MSTKAQMIKSQTPPQVRGPAPQPLQALRPSPRRLSQVRHLPDLLPEPGQPRPDPGRQEGELVSRPAIDADVDPTCLDSRIAETPRRADAARPPIVSPSPGALPAAVDEDRSAMMTDPIADMLTRIRNAVRIERPLVDMPASKIRRGIAQVLKDEGYIWDFEEIETVPARTLRLHMKYGPNGERLITRIDRVSKPGRRVYSGYKELKPILGGMGIQILSTPQGVISDRRARAEKVGGEVLALIH